MPQAPILSAQDHDSRSRYLSILSTGDHAPLIQDVVWLEASRSILGETAPGALAGSLSGRTYTLQITGSRFFKGRKTANQFAFTFPSGVLWQTAIGPIPHGQVLIDGAIPLQPDPTTSPTPELLTVTVDTKRILDYYLKGTHYLTVVDGPDHHTVPIRFGDTEGPAGDFSPSIFSAEKVSEKEALLRVSGRNFFLDFHKSWAKVDGVRAYWHSTQLSLDAATADTGTIHLPESFMRRPGANRILLATPFGVVWHTF